MGASVTVKAIGGLYEYSKSAKYQIGRPGSVCPAGRADATGLGEPLVEGPVERVDVARLEFDELDEFHLYLQVVASNVRQ